MRQPTCFFCFLMICSGMVWPAGGKAQKIKKNEPDAIAEQLTRITRRYHDSISRISHYYRTQWKYTRPDTLANPYYFHLFSPAIINDRQLRRAMTLPDSVGRDDVQQTIERVILQSYAEHPQEFNFAEFKHVSSDKINPLTSSQIASETIEKDLDVNPETELNENYAIPGEVDVVAYKPNFWKLKTDFSMQFIQNHVSKNWHKGGESNFSLLGTWNVEANYDNKRKITFENKLEMKLGFQTSKSDKMHKFKTNNDQLRLTNKFGLRAIGDWSYNFMLQSWTQFYPGYKSNDAFVYSDILSPLDAVFSVGMAYNKSFRKANLSINPSPLAYNFRYVKRNSLIGSMGLKEGHHTQYTLGSTITANLSWTIAKNIQWTSRFYYFTDYKKVQAEWENTFTLTINKYLKTQLFLYPRYDDGVTRQPGRSYFQFSEWLSFGLNMSFQK